MRSIRGSGVILFPALADSAAAAVSRCGDGGRTSRAAASTLAYSTSSLPTVVCPPSRLCIGWACRSSQVGGSGLLCPASRNLPWQVAMRRRGGCAAAPDEYTLRLHKSLMINAQRCEFLPPLVCLSLFVQSPEFRCNFLLPLF
jgi:hypothetical protein